MTLFALIDCNNFYASCERIFNPKLQNRAIVILSNNDGCIIARSEEAKKLGIKMGAPYFECKRICEINSVFVLSSNFELYGNISNRVMQAIKHFASDVEIYSIDEAFVKLSNISTQEVDLFIKNIRETIRKWIGITVSIGVGKTKTLAKIANKIAKKREDGVFFLQNTPDHEAILQNFDIEDIWGVGNKLSLKLRMMGIGKASQLKDADPKMIRSNFTVVGEKMVMELNGISCYGLEEIQDKKNIVCSRSFGINVTQLTMLKEAVSDYTVKACDRMRAQKTYTLGFYLFFRIKGEKPGRGMYQFTDVHRFCEHTDDSFLIVKKANELTEKYFKVGTIYKKAGIVLLDLVNKAYVQKSLFGELNTKNTILLDVMSGINKKMGKNSLFLAAQGTKKLWSMKSGQKSPRYTTNWNEIPTV